LRFATNWSARVIDADDRFRHLGGLRRTLEINGKRSRAASHRSESAPSVAARRRERVLHGEMESGWWRPRVLAGQVDLGHELAARVV
jgi:hypothetical protein